jgi:hypothetical protein
MRAMDSAASSRRIVTESSSPAATGRLCAQAPASFVALRRYIGANGREAEFKSALRARARLCADDDRAWHRGCGYRESHCGIPTGLKPVGRETWIDELEVVCE